MVPDYCSNRVIVSGPAEQVEELVRLVDGCRFDFWRILPMPECLKQTESYGGSDVRTRQVLPDGTVAHVPVEQEELAQWRQEHGADNWLDWS